MVRLITAGFHPQLVSISLVFLLAPRLSARHEGTELGEGGHMMSNFSFQKEAHHDVVVPNEDVVEKINKFSRKMASGERTIGQASKASEAKKLEQRKKRVSVASSYGEENRKEYFMAADYRSPKSHPPRNN